MDSKELDAYLDRVLIGDREPGPVVLVESDPAWPARFARERARIDEALGATALRVEHIGSTSVPGLAAKPIVDIVLTVDDVEDDTAFLPSLENAGYALRVREAGHRMLRPPDRGVHVHVLADKDPEVHRYLTFRDRLRSSAEDRRAYELLKRELATRDWAEINFYADAKGPLIEAILARCPRADFKIKLRSQASIGTARESELGLSAAVASREGEKRSFLVLADRAVDRSPRDREP